MSEKTIKPILAKRPFVLMSNPGSLKFLKQSGFKTFERWWDESYDDILDPTDRLKKIVDIITEIAQAPLSRLRSMYEEMQEIIDYNFDYYHTDFYPNEVKKFEASCQKNLGYR